jgi:hypothetical protein
MDPSPPSATEPLSNSDPGTRCDDTVIVDEDASLTPDEKISLVKWHLDRYDRLRVSTASRASVVLSAGAILSAGNALILSQLLGSSNSTMRTWVLTVFTVGLTVSSCLVMLSLIRASRVLVTPKDSRRMFASSGELPAGLLFNGTDTVRLIASFRDFQAAVRSQDQREILDAAQVELWIVIQQHRHRYVELRAAVRVLRWAALAFLLVFVGIMITNLLTRF